MPFPMLPQLLPLRGIYEMLPIQLGPIYVYMSAQLNFFSDEAHRLNWVGAKSQQTYEKGCRSDSYSCRKDRGHT